ncbi:MULTISPECIES: molybdate ABC transporter substrate-binding protein [Calothrix]|uniref:Molybdate ABC transporter substrate-binding protein n=2 Tax=Calothrix TaxID=1186 RepID=A0ABR8AC92_9CYAN|nr:MULTISPECIES: molybdate ABC transporter substrate-binding protein [Calothrix]MBD2197519.1 molybdate ABC transporter substrate-binding protein [Calothrix parietina FACHB-288]MBD2226107.1 molybdate ABC transporter substrate-binding protein [Calothrix anomala FACHB-343]
MHTKRILAFVGWMLTALVLLIACNQTSTPNPTASAASLTISAAASLKDALQEIKPLYAKQQPQVKLTYNFGSSGALQQQIEQGASVDVFISAANKQMDALTQKGLLVDSTRKDLLKNELVLIVPQQAQNIKDFLDLANPSVKKIALGEPKSVPAGQYALQVLTALKIADQIKPKVVYAKDVRQALNYVESGNTDAGIVYLSDAKTSQKVKVVVTAPETSHSPIVYPIAVLKSSKYVDAAENFVQFLSGNAVKDVFEKQGFKVIGQ